MPWWAQGDAADAAAAAWPQEAEGAEEQGDDDGESLALYRGGKRGKREPGAPSSSAAAGASAGASVPPGFEGVRVKAEKTAATASAQQQEQPLRQSAREAAEAAFGAGVRVKEEKGAAASVAVKQEPQQQQGPAPGKENAVLIAEGAGLVAEVGDATGGGVEAPPAKRKRAARVVEVIDLTMLEDD